MYIYQEYIIYIYIYIICIYIYIYYMYIYQEIRRVPPRKPKIAQHSPTFWWQ